MVTRGHQFERYLPSLLEHELVSTYRKGRICETATNRTHIDSSRRSLAYAASSAAAAANGHQSPLPADEHSQALSFFHDSTGATWPIEPLTVMARHPFADLGCVWPRDPRIPKRENFDNISYLVVPNFCNSSAVVAGSVRLFDLGCGNHPLRKTGKSVKDGGGSAPSIGLLDQIYKSRCLPIDQIYAWEAREQSPAAFWKAVPATLLGRVHFYNTPVQAEQFLELLATIVKPEDYVIIKLDLEGHKNHQELPIVHALRDRKEFAHLVDELFFEAHFYFDGLNFGWGNKWGRRHKPDVDDALKLMSALRHNGIRAHFWI